MSFILDALRKVERQRRGELRGTILGPPPSRQPRRGLWGLVAVLAGLNAVGWGLVLSRSGPGVPPRVTGEAGSSAVEVGGTAGPRGGLPRTAPAGEPLTPGVEAPPAARAGASAPTAEERQARVGTPARNAGAGPPAPRAGDSREGPVPRPAQALLRARPSSGEPAAPRARTDASPATPRARGTSAAEGSAGALPGPGTSEPRVPVATGLPASRILPRPGPAAPPDPGASERFPAPRAATAPTAGPAELPPVFRDALRRLRLEVLVDAEDPRDREVFINGRRYRAGDRLDDDLMVEEIVSEGVLLSWQGHRAWLRHARPP